MSKKRAPRLPYKRWVAPCLAEFDRYGEMVQHGLQHTDHAKCNEWARWSVGTKKESSDGEAAGAAQDAHKT